MEKQATREAYGQALEALGAANENVVVLDADLSKSTKTNLFQKKFPERFFDMGIAEADMVGVAAGMSLCGFKPFVNTFAMFAAGRAWEQVRNSVARATATRCGWPLRRSWTTRARPTCVWAVWRSRP